MLNILFLLMNNQDNLIFGNSYRIYYYKKIYEIQTDGPKEIKRIENYYYSIDNYVDDLDYVGEENEKRYNNNETSTYIIATYIILVKTYKLYDVNGNYLILDIDENYPKAICKNVSEIAITRPVLNEDELIDTDVLKIEFTYKIII